MLAALVNSNVNGLESKFDNLHEFLGGAKKKSCRATEAKIHRLIGKSEQTKQGTNQTCKMRKGSWQNQSQFQQYASGKTNKLTNKNTNANGEKNK